MLSFYILFAWSAMLHQANNFLLPCPFKSLTGLDCPGCGFQRSFVALLEGHWQESFQLYPATVPLLLTFIIILPANYWTRKDRSLLIKALSIVTGVIILVSYLYKVC